MTTPEERHQEGLYWALFAEFGEIAHALGGWHSIQGILLSDKLKVMAEKLRVIGVQPEAIVRRAAAAGAEGRP